MDLTVRLDHPNPSACLPQVPGWEMIESNGHLEIQRKWKAKNFVSGLQFLSRVADVAEAEGEPPAGR